MCNIKVVTPLLILSLEILTEARPPLECGAGAEPYNTLVKAFSSYGEVDVEQFQKLTAYLERIPLPEGHVLWKQNDPSDGLYIVESGILRAVYKFSDHTLSIEESMVPGTLAGELSALSSLPRNATVVVEHSAVLWKLSIQNLRRLETDHPALAATFTQLVLKSRFLISLLRSLEILRIGSRLSFFVAAAKIDYDTLLAALAARQ
jgi:SulP family sulfate permease